MMVIDAAAGEAGSGDNCYHDADTATWEDHMTGLEKPRLRWLAVATLAWVSLTLPAAAQDPAAEEPEEPRWQGSAGLAFVTTSGNTDTQNVGLDFALKRKPEPWGLELTVKVERAEEEGVETAERYLAGLRGTRALNERWELFAGVSGEQDTFAGLDLRTLVEAGAVYHALLGPEHLLSFDLGATWTDEDRVPPALDVDYLGAVAGVAYEWKFSESASLTERLVYYPNFDDAEDWRLDSTTALTASLNERFALQLSYAVRYRNLPVGGRDDTDTTTKASLVLKL